MTSVSNPADWDGAAFDPRAIRHFSILPDEDADEGYCVRHEVDMRQINPVVHTDGALYTTAEVVSVYTCPSCLAELDREAGKKGVGAKAYKSALSQAFNAWDDGEAPIDWFRYLGEGTVEDLSDGEKFVALENGGGRGDG